MANAVATDTPETISASTAAFEADDFAAFDRAEQARERGEPLPPISTEPVPVKSETGPELSRRQQKINERAQVAVDRATADLQAENARLKAENTTLKAPPVARTAPAPEMPRAPLPTTPAKPKDYVSLPGAPKLEDYESVPAFTAAMTAFVIQSDRQDAERAVTAERHRADMEQTTTAYKAKIDGFVGQLHQAQEADPNFTTNLTDQVKHDLKPFDALPMDPRDPTGRVRVGAGPINVIGEQVYDSDIAAPMLQFFSDHPEELERLITVPERMQNLPPTLQAAAHVKWMTQEYGKLEDRVSATLPTAAPEKVRAAVPSTISKAPPPAPTLSRASATKDPQHAAFQRNDFREWERTETQKAINRRKGL